MSNGDGSQREPSPNRPRMKTLSKNTPFSIENKAGYKLYFVCPA